MCEEESNTWNKIQNDGGGGCVGERKQGGRQTGAQWRFTDGLVDFIVQGHSPNHI